MSPNPTQTIILIVVGIIIVANFIYTIRSVRVNRRLLEHWRMSAPADNFLMEHIVHTRSSLNLVYASITIATGVLAFLGFDLQETIVKETNLQVFKKLDSYLTVADSAVVECRKALNDVLVSRERVQYLAGKVEPAAKVVLASYELVKQSPQKVFVIEKYPLNSGTTKVRFADLTAIDGIPMPALNGPPVMIVNSNPPFENIAEVKSIARDYFDIYVADPAQLDFWIHVR